MRTCTACHVAKPLTEYNRHTKAAAGWNTQCRRCGLDRRNLLQLDSQSGRQGGGPVRGRQLR